MGDHERHNPIIPPEGMDKGELLERLRAMAGDDVRWREHRVFALVYDLSPEHLDFLQEAYGLFFATNALNPMAFKSLRIMEHEVVSMTANLLHGGANAAGVMTSGGTESLLLPVLAYRQRARARRPWIRRPEILVPDSAHPALMKAGEYFDVRIVRTPLMPDFRVDVDAMRRRITSNTIAIVGSAPCYPYGVIDPIEALADLAREHGIGLHVDACLGGFLLPWVERAGHPLPLWDFRVPGVTSISADVHKYGYAAKGASVIVYRSMDLLRHQFFADADWCGGVYASTSLPGTRPGGAIAAAWASLMAIGENGFKDNARRMLAVTERFKEGVQGIPPLEILGHPPVGVMAIGSHDRKIGAFAVADFLGDRGWHVDRLQRPESIHLILNPGHAHIAEDYFNDLQAAVEYVRTHPDSSLEGSAPMYGLVAKAPMRRMVKRNVLQVLERLHTNDAYTDNATHLPAPLLGLMRLRARVARLLGR
ncbi:MAG TPA: aspartate aminotransferase family protein [Candidatus Hydrogenedentes bacterium]|nr:aspartate aminotransferase family protein [Candidatus Hydrogenedentota bacterium]HOV75220.1 aspartate aminotransferase family protein [Candidatus Hydrogenedentota bacterium]HPC17588.1 aspartate aminotransferase family protein [Candidatus Hydrogenedentota bacterium]HRT21473.1 aspartate aminotransferase family protein [Candidatus Hydrogenedentota bacterium]HRT63923.1 aspartate aminotransferase family protein [Candidatus Hydrogenedentota bacterium]